MNYTKIEWCDMTWNPVTGCLHGCEYCYAKKVAHRFDGKVFDTSPLPGGLHVLEDRPPWPPYPYGFAPTFHRYRLGDPASKTKGKTIFVCSMADLFGSWVPTKWIVDVLDACLAAPQHRYLFLTKNPKRYLELNEVALLPHQDNFWYGSTATNPETDLMAWSDSFHTFVSIEPMLGPFGVPSPSFNHNIGWYIIGAETGNRKGKVVPKKEWVQEVVDYCREAGKPVFMKDSLLPIMGEAGMVREFPWNMKKGGAWSDHLRNRFERVE